MKSRHIEPEHPTKVLQEKKGDCIILHYPTRMMKATRARIKCAFQNFPAKSCSSVSEQSEAVTLPRERWTLSLVGHYSPHGALPPAAPQNIPARIGSPLYAPAAQGSGQREERNPRVPKYFGAQRKGGTCQWCYSNSQFLLFFAFLIFSSPFLTRLCSFPTQHGFQTSNPSLQSRPKQPHLQCSIFALVTQWKTWQRLRFSFFLQQTPPHGNLTHI